VSLPVIIRPLAEGDLREAQACVRRGPRALLDRLES